MKPLGLLLMTENGQWVGVCTEYDIVAQGDSEQDALNVFAAIWRMQSRLDHERGRGFPDSIPATPNDAPWSYRDRFDQAAAGRPWLCQEHDASGALCTREFEVRVVRA